MNIIQKVKTFFQEVYSELRKVTWLSRNQVIQYTFLVLLVTIIVAAFLGGLDYLFSSVIKQFIVK